MSVTPDPALKSKLPAKRKLAVIVCEIRDGQNWPLMTIHQGPKGCSIISGEKAAPRCLQVLPQALDTVLDTVARQQCTLSVLANEFRQQFEALIGFPPAPEREDLSTPLPAPTPETAALPADDVPAADGAAEHFDTSRPE